MNSPTLRLLPYLRHARRPALLALAAGSAAAASSIALTAAAAWLIVRAAQHPPVLHLTVAIVAVRTFGLGRGVLRYVERLAGHDAAFRMLGEIRARGYASLERLAPAGLRGTRSGDLVARFVSDMDAAVDVLTRVILPFAAAALVGLATAAVLGTMVPLIGVLLVAGVLVACSGVPALHTAVAGTFERSTAALRGDLSAQIVELLHGAPDLLAYQAVQQRLAIATNADRRLRAAAHRASLSVGLSGALLTLTGGACVWLSLTLGTASVRAGTLDPVFLGVLVLTPLALFDGLTSLPAAAADSNRARHTLKRVFATFDQPSRTPEPARPEKLPAGPYRLSLHGVRARWENTDTVVGINLDLPPGRKVALVGPNGCGKSTLAALMVRFLDPTEGSVTLNGVNLRHLTGEEIRRIVGYVAEDAHIFDSTIEDNLRIGNPQATVEELWAAIIAVRLDTWINTLPHGLTTSVGERGQRISGGQRRRLILARALVADQPILIVDEPTEHLDEPTAAAITTDLLDATAGRTVVLITHQPHGLDEVDEVITMSTGRIRSLAVTA